MASGGARSRAARTALLQRADGSHCRRQVAAAQRQEEVRAGAGHCAGRDALYAGYRPQPADAFRLVRAHLKSAQCSATRATAERCSSSNRQMQEYTRQVTGSITAMESTSATLPGAPSPMMLTRYMDDIVAKVENEGVTVDAGCASPQHAFRIIV